MSHNNAKGTCNLVTRIREDREGEGDLFNSREGTVGLLRTECDEGDPFASECGVYLKRV